MIYRQQRYSSRWNDIEQIGNSITVKRLYSCVIGRAAGVLGSGGTEKIHAGTACSSSSLRVWITVDLNHFRIYLPGIKYSSNSKENGYIM